VKVLLLSNLFPTSSDPNRGLFTAQLAAEMRGHCDLRVMVPLPWTPQGALAASILPARYREFALASKQMLVRGVEAQYPRYPLLPRVSERWHPALMRLTLRRRLERLRREFPFEVILSQWLYPDGVAAVAIGRELGVPVVVSGLGCDVNEYLFHPEKRQQLLEALQGAAAITVVSSELADVLSGTGIPAGRITVIPNGVDTTRFHPASREAARAALGLDAQRPLVVCVSRLSPEKGVQVLVEAVPLLARLRAGIHVAVVGDGPERSTLLERISRDGSADSIRMVGAVPHEQVATWLAAADVVCMPSLREGHPNAAMETLASGRPLVASRVGALRSMINDGVGRLVPPGDADALAHALDDALGMSWDEAAISRTVEDSSWSAAAKRYLEVLARHAARPDKAA